MNVAKTTLNSKYIGAESEHFAALVVDAIQGVKTVSCCLTPDLKMTLDATGDSEWRHKISCSSNQCSENTRQISQRIHALRWVCIISDGSSFTGNAAADYWRQNCFARFQSSTTSNAIGRSNSNHRSKRTRTSQTEVSDGRTKEHCCFLGSGILPKQKLKRF